MLVPGPMPRLNYVRLTSKVPKALDDWLVIGLNETKQLNQRYQIWDLECNITGYAGRNKKVHEHTHVLLRSWSHGRET